MKSKKKTKKGKKVGSNRSPFFKLEKPPRDKMITLSKGGIKIK